jgi:hypothetical protein
MASCVPGELIRCAFVWHDLRNYPPAIAVRAFFCLLHPKNDASGTKPLKIDYPARTARQRRRSEMRRKSRLALIRFNPLDVCEHARGSEETPCSLPGWGP